MKNRDKLKKVFAEALIMDHGRLRGKRTSEMRIVETLVRMAQTIKTINSIVVEEDGRIEKQTMHEIFQECLEKYVSNVQKNGNFEPLADTVNRMKEAQKELKNGIVSLAMALVKIRTMQENVKEEEFHFDIEGLVRQALESSNMPSFDEIPLPEAIPFEETFQAVA